MAAKEDNRGVILKNFEEAQPVYEAFASKIESLIQELLKNASIDIHSITSRVKESGSLADKLARDVGEKYENLEDVTDLSGVRITCWLLEEIPRIEKVIRENFKINENLSVDKREVMAADRFGYVSVHYVISLSEERKSLNEFKRYADLCCEVQIRTILQHAWAEIEHDLGYKSKIEVPKSIKRRFYRLAGLFELADDEFQRLRIDIEEYKNNVNELIEKKEKNILLDKISLESYVENSDVVTEIDEKIMECFGPNEELQIAIVCLENNLKTLAFFNIRTTEELEEILQKNASKIIKLAERWIEGDDVSDGITPRGISIFYLGYYLAGKTGDKGKIESYLNVLDIDSEIAPRLIELTRDL